MTMTARERMHESYCSELGSHCLGLGAEPSEKCQKFDELLREVEAEAVSTSAQKVLDQTMDTMLVHGPQVMQGMVLAYKIQLPDMPKEEPT